MNKEKQEEMSKEEKKAVKLKEKEEKKATKLKNKEEKKAVKIKKKEENKKKKIDKTTIFRKIMAALLIAFTLLGTCYTFIYLVVNA